MKYNNKQRKYRYIVVAISLIFATSCYIYTYNEIFCVFKKVGIEKIVNIPEKSSINKIGNILKNEKIISNSLIFKIYSKIKKNIKLKSGHFKLKENMKYNEIVNILCDASKNVYDETIVITEGMNFFTIENKFNNNISLNIKEIIKYINDINYIYNLDIYKYIKENSNKTYFLFEGFVSKYTFPIYKNYNEKTMALRILKKSNEEFKKIKDYIDNNKEKTDLNLWEIFTLASIIQAETSDENEMPKISSVFHNRLKANKRLESDVTTLYSKKIEKDMKAKSFRIDQNKIRNYDTYQTKGLPPGPICMPSFKAIEAAIKPTKTNYYFFYANPKTGHIVYGKNFEDHKRNINLCK